MIEQVKGHCKHGEFDLKTGCPKCVAEFLGSGLATSQIVKVRYYSETTGELSPREYTYYSAESLKVGDIVIVPVRDTTGKAKVSAVDVPEVEIASFKDKVKTISAGSVVKVEGAYTRQSTGDAPASVGSTTVESMITLQAELKSGNYHGEKTETALVKINPEADMQVQAFYKEALGLQKYAETRVIKTVEDLKPANDDLNIIRRLRKAMEEKRKEYVSPLNDHVKAINNAFKTLMEPVEIADKITGDKMLAFNREQDRIRREQEEINRLRQLAASKDAALHNGEISEPVNLVEVIPEAPRQTRTEMGSSGMRDNWTFEIISFADLPDEYKMPDATKIGKVVRAGLRNIPGVRIFNQPIIATHR